MDLGFLRPLFGETGDLRRRIKQYVTGTQDRGNKLWKETFLSLGDIRLYTLELATGKTKVLIPGNVFACCASWQPLPAG